MHVGILFACLCFQKFGIGVFRRREIWLFGVVSLGVPLAWYWHAHSLWLEYGNSLGISNEAYERISTGNFLVTLWETIPGVIAIESVCIWMGIGLLFGMSGLKAACNSVVAKPLMFWFAALAAFFVVTGRTTGENWAAYYHIVSVPLAALLMGLGFVAADRSHALITVRAAAGIVIGAVVAFVAVKINAGTMELLPRMALLVGAISAVVGLVVRFENSPESGWSKEYRGLFLRSRGPISLCFVLIAGCQLYAIRHDSNPRQFEETYQTAVTLARHVKGGELIVVGGVSTVDQHGLLRAADCPYIFFWMDRKGFILHDDEQSLDRVYELRRRGARFFVAERSHLNLTPGFEPALRRQFTLLDEQGDTLLIDLGTTGVMPSDAVQASTSLLGDDGEAKQKPTDS